MYKIFHLLIVISVFFFVSCEKEGKGGSAIIEGKIEVRLINKITLDTLTTYLAPDEKVYIIYGENETFDDDTRTTHNGKFQFNYLYKGDYTIYAYSECILHLDSCPAEIKAEIKKITINSNKETINIPSIIINKYFK